MDKIYIKLQSRKQLLRHNKKNKYKFINRLSNNHLGYILMMTNSMLATKIKQKEIDRYKSLKLLSFKHHKNNKLSLSVKQQT